MRWLATALIAVLTGLAAFVLFARAAQPGTVANLFGRVVGFVVTPFAIGFALAWLLGKLRAGTEGAMHRRTNWIALIIALASTFGNAAQMAP